MRVPADAIIPEDKLTRYLLVLREYDDKSNFLSQAGFTLENPGILRKAIRQLVAATEAIEERGNEYGTFYRVDGYLEGTAGRRLAVITIWLRWKSDDMFRFVTLKPLRGARRET